MLFWPVRLIASCFLKFDGGVISIKLILNCLHFTLCTLLVL